MRPHYVKSLPSVRYSVITETPEIHHLQILEMMAVRCGPRSAFVEHGKSNGAVTHTFLAAMKELPDSRLIVVGGRREVLEPIIAHEGMTERVEFVDTLPALEHPPALYFIGDPDVVADAVTTALDSNARVIVVYDVRAADRLRLQRFQPMADAAAILKQRTDRRYDEESRAISFQQTRRGMLISELLNYVPPAAAEASQSKEVSAIAASLIGMSKPAAPAPPEVREEPVKQTEPAAEVPEVKVPEQPKLAVWTPAPVVAQAVEPPADAVADCKMPPSPDPSPAVAPGLPPTKQGRGKGRKSRKLDKRTGDK